jgi:hypothetical protein
VENPEGRSDTSRPSVLAHALALETGSNGLAGGTAGVATQPKVEPVFNQRNLPKHEQEEFVWATYENLSTFYKQTSTLLALDAVNDEFSRGYALADADEGTACYGIVGGEGSGGHKWDVIDVAFHPSRAVIATCCQDWWVRIWALPETPSVDVQDRTAKGYRPALISFPLFGTNRIHAENIDNIEWYV